MSSTTPPSSPPPTPSSSSFSAPSTSTSSSNNTPTTLTAATTPTTKSASLPQPSTSSSSAVDPKDVLARLQAAAASTRAKTGANGSGARTPRINHGGHGGSIGGSQQKEKQEPEEEEAELDEDGNPKPPVQVLHADSILELQKFAEKKAWIDEKVQLLSSLPVVDPINPQPPARSATTREELETWWAEHDRIETEVDEFDKGDLDSLRSFAKAASQRNLSSKDADLIEITLTTLFSIDKLMHLLRERTMKLNLLDLRLTWDDQVHGLWRDRDNLREVEWKKFLSKARWTRPPPPGMIDLNSSARSTSSSSRQGTPYLEPPGTPGGTDGAGEGDDLSASGSSLLSGPRGGIRQPSPSPNRNSILYSSLGRGKSASVSSQTPNGRGSPSPIPGSASSSTAMPGRGVRSEVLTLDLTQQNSKIYNLSHTSVAQSGKTLDALIDTSSTPLPDSFLDEQDRVEAEIKEFIEGIGGFFSQVVSQHKAADEVYFRVQSVVEGAEGLEREVNNSTVGGKLPERDRARKFEDSIGEMRRKIRFLRGCIRDKVREDGSQHQERKGAVPMPTHKSFPDQIEWNKRIRQELEAELEDGRETLGRTEEAVRFYRLGAEAVERARKVRREMLSCKERLEREVLGGLLDNSEGRPDFGQAEGCLKKEGEEKGKEEAWEKRIAKAGGELEGSLMTLKEGLYKESDRLADKARASVAELTEAAIDPIVKRDLKELMEGMLDCRRKAESGLKRERDHKKKVADVRKAWNKVEKCLEETGYLREALATEMTGETVRWVEGCQGKPASLDKLDKRLEGLRKAVAECCHPIRSEEGPNSLPAFLEPDYRRLMSVFKLGESRLMSGLDNLQEMRDVLGKLRNQREKVTVVLNEADKLGKELDDEKKEVGKCCERGRERWKGGGDEMKQKCDESEKRYRELRQRVEALTASIDIRVPFVAQQHQQRSHSSSSETPPNGILSNGSSHQNELVLGEFPHDTLRPLLPSSLPIVPLNLDAQDKSVRDACNAKMAALAGSVDELGILCENLGFLTQAFELDSRFDEAQKGVSTVEQKLKNLDAVLQHAASCDIAKAASDASCVQDDIQALEAQLPNLRSILLGLESLFSTSPFGQSLIPARQEALAKLESDIARLSQDLSTTQERIRAEENRREECRVAWLERRAELEKDTDHEETQLNPVKEHAAQAQTGLEDWQAQFEEVDARLKVMEEAQIPDFPDFTCPELTSFEELFATAHSQMDEFRPVLDAVLSARSSLEADIASSYLKDNEADLAPLKNRHDASTEALTSLLKQKEAMEKSLQDFVKRRDDWLAREHALRDRTNKYRAECRSSWLERRSKLDSDTQISEDQLHGLQNQLGEAMVSLDQWKTQFTDVDTRLRALEEAIVPDFADFSCPDLASLEDELSKITSAIEEYGPSLETVIDARTVLEQDAGSSFLEEGEENLEDRRARHDTLKEILQTLKIQQQELQQALDESRSQRDIWVGREKALRERAEKHQAECRAAWLQRLSQLETESQAYGERAQAVKGSVQGAETALSNWRLEFDRVDEQLRNLEEADPPQTPETTCPELDSVAESVSGASAQLSGLQPWLERLIAARQSIAADAASSFLQGDESGLEPLESLLNEFSPALEEVNKKGEELNEFLAQARRDREAWLERERRLQQRAEEARLAREQSKAEWMEDVRNLDAQIASHKGQTVDLGLNIGALVTRLEKESRVFDDSADADETEMMAIIDHFGEVCAGVDCEKTKLAASHKELANKLANLEELAKILSEKEFATDEDGAELVKTLQNKIAETKQLLANHEDVLVRLSTDLEAAKSSCETRIAAVQEAKRARELEAWMTQRNNLEECCQIISKALSELEPDLELLEETFNSIGPDTSDEEIDENLGTLLAAAHELQSRMAAVNASFTSLQSSRTPFEGLPLPEAEGVSKLRQEILEKVDSLGERIGSIQDKPDSLHSQLEDLRKARAGENTLLAELRERLGNLDIPGLLLNEKEDSHSSLPTRPSFEETQQELINIQDKLDDVAATKQSSPVVTDLANELRDKQGALGTFSNLVGFGERLKLCHDLLSDLLDAVDELEPLTDGDFRSNTSPIPTRKASGRHIPHAPSISEEPDEPVASTSRLNGRLPPLARASPTPQQRKLDTVYEATSDAVESLHVAAGPVERDVRVKRNLRVIDETWEEMSSMAKDAMDRSPAPTTVPSESPSRPTTASPIDARRKSNDSTRRSAIPRRAPPSVKQDQTPTKQNIRSPSSASSSNRMSMFVTPRSRVTSITTPKSQPRPASSASTRSDMRLSSSTSSLGNYRSVNRSVGEFGTNPGGTSGSTLPYGRHSLSRSTGNNFRASLSSNNLGAIPSNAAPVRTRKSSSSLMSSRTRTTSTSSLRPLRKPNMYKPNIKRNLDVQVGRIVNDLPIEVAIKPVEGYKDNAGQYWVGDKDPRLCFCRILRSNTVMVRVGGGWQELGSFLFSHFSSSFSVNAMSSMSSIAPAAPTQPSSEEKWISARTVSKSKDAYSQLGVASGGGPPGLSPRVSLPRQVSSSSAISTTSDKDGERDPSAPPEAFSMFMRKHDSPPSNTKRKISIPWRF